MNSYTDIDGVPVAGDRSLLTGLLRDEYGFTGTVVSDYFAVPFLETLHHVAADLGAAARIALVAGIDVELPTVHAYGDALVGKLESGEVDMALLERSVRRVLVQKCELGLLDPDWSPEPPIMRTGAGILDEPRHRALARRLAERSIVLLSNDGCLPLRPGQKVAVVGPLSAQPSAMLGCYSFPMHVGARHPGLPVGVSVPTLVEALRDDPAGYAIAHAQGCTVLGGGPGLVADAARAAADSDVCVAVLGDQAGLFGAGTSGEGCDAADLRLPGAKRSCWMPYWQRVRPLSLSCWSGGPMTSRAKPTALPRRYTPRS